MDTYVGMSVGMIVCENVLWVVGICCGNCLWEFPVGIVCGNFQWEFSVGIVFGNFVLEYLWVFVLGLFAGSSVGMSV